MSEEVQEPEVEETVNEETPAEEQQTAEEPKAEAQPEQKNEWQERYMRLSAEFDNFKRRTNREKEELLSVGNSQILKALFPVMDNLDRTLRVAETTEPEALIKSLKLVHKNLLSTLDKQGVQPFDSIGEPFDSEKHDAIASMPVEDEAQKGKVIEEIEKGYIYNERIIRFAKVITGE